MMKKAKKANRGHRVWIEGGKLVRLHGSIANGSISLMNLLNLDNEYGFLSDADRGKAEVALKTMRDLSETSKREKWWSVMKPLVK